MHGELEQTLAHHTEQPISELNLEVTKNSEVHLEAQTEQSLSLQDWLGCENQLPATHQFHTAEIRLEDQLHIIENRSHTNEE